MDQFAQQGEVVDLFGQLAGCQQALTVLRQLGEIGDPAQLFQRLVALEIGLQRHRRRDRIAVEQLVDALVNALVHRFVEMMRLERGIKLLHDLVVDQHRAKECGFRLDIAGQGLALLVGGGSRIIGGEEEIGVGHARHHGRGSAAPQAKHVAKLALSLVDSGDYRATP